MRSPTLIRGYWNKPEATAETIQKGWLRSGDIGRIDAEGFLYIEDRAKDMVLRAGEIASVPPPREWPSRDALRTSAPAITNARDAPPKGGRDRRLGARPGVRHRGRRMGR